MKITNSDLKRFSKQIILKNIGVTGQKKIFSAKVLVIGVGGLGCPLILYLANSGVGNIGVVDHVNKQKEVIHFIVRPYIDGVIRFSELDDSFLEGDAIAVRIHRFKSKQGSRYRTFTAKKTTKPIPKSILKSFEEEVREIDGMGFTIEEGIFIPPPLVNDKNIKDGDRVSGKAIINFNKKKLEWGWKALSIDNVSSS